jgi:hypothetical protein
MSFIYLTFYLLSKNVLFIFSDQKISRVVKNRYLIPTFNGKQFSSFKLFLLGSNQSFGLLSESDGFCAHKNHEQWFFGKDYSSCSLIIKTHRSDRHVHHEISNAALQRPVLATILRSVFSCCSTWFSERY